MRRAIAFLILAACGGAIEAPTPPGADAELVPDAGPRRPSRLEREDPFRPCLGGDELVAWRGGDNGYNARVIFCTRKAGRGAFPLCAVRWCVEDLPAKRCDDTQFTACENALDVSTGLEEPASCEPCF